MPKKFGRHNPQNRGHCSSDELARMPDRVSAFKIESYRSAIESKISWLEKQAEIRAQHGEVKVIMKDGKPIGGL